VEYIGSIAAYDRKMPESDIRPRKKFSAFQLRKTDWGPTESFSEPKKTIAAAKQAGKRIIRLVWGILNLYGSARVKPEHCGY